MESRIAFFFSFALLLVAVNGHAYLSDFIIGSTSQGAGTCVRPRNTAGLYGNSPIMDLSTLPNGILSNNMTCGFTPSPAAQTCTVAAGAQVGLQWWHNGPGASDDIIDTSHKGPVIVYMAKSSTGSGPVWFKIYEAGYDTTRQKWAVEDLITNRGVVKFNIPADISAGNYLLRGEIIALHEGNRANGAQPYVGCVQLAVTGSGTANPTGVAIPGVYTKTDPGILFDIYTGQNRPYPIPGPAVYRAGSTGSTPSAGTGSAECAVGSEGCACTAGGSCDGNLKCVAVNAGSFCVSTSGAMVSLPWTFAILALMSLVYLI